MTNELVTIENSISPYAIMPVMDVQYAARRRQALIDYTAALMVKGRDFGKIPGAGDKPTLLKPGAEKLASLFGLSPVFDVADREMDWTGADHDGEAFFYLQYRCTLYRGDAQVGQGMGSCNSWEKKYRFRGGVKNPNPADLVNTIDKMAQKRALVAAVLIAVNASEFFTQDIEDYSDIVDGDWQPAAAPAPTKAATPAAKPQPKAKADPDVVEDTTGSIEDIIRERPAGEFIVATAALLELTEDAVRERMKALGYAKISGKPDERVDMFHALQAYKAQTQPAAQPALTDAPLFVQDGAYTES